jgi:trimethylamine--corrinoid protein Co-methyltransferase
VIRKPDASGYSNRGMSLNVFSEADVDDIHLATLEVLERAGVFVEDDEALDVFSDGGCRVNRETRMVKIPGHIVEEAIRSAPPKAVLNGRDPEKDIVLEAGRVAFCNFDEGLAIVDRTTGELRKPTLADVAEAATIVDALDQIDSYESAVGATDVPPETGCLHNTEVALNYTTKPVGSAPLNGFDARKLLEMAKVVIDGDDDDLRDRCVVGMGVCSVSPLKLPRDATEVILVTARHGVPNTVLSMAMSGGSSPITMAGTLVLHNAEVLSGITLAQLAGRGTPCIYGSSTTGMDMRLAAASVGSPELAKISAGVAQLARQYRLPSFVAGA